MSQGLTQEDHDLIERASYDVDESLLAWYETLSLIERVRSSVNFLTTLSRFRKVEDEAPQNLPDR